MICQQKPFLFLRPFFCMLGTLILFSEAVACKYTYRYPKNTPQFSQPLTKEMAYREMIIKTLKGSCIFPEHIRTLEVEGTHLTHFFSYNGALSTALGTLKDGQETFEKHAKENAPRNKENSLIHLIDGNPQEDIFRPIAQFHLTYFDENYLKKIKDSQFDIIFLTNIDGFLRRDFTLQNLQDLMENLLSKTKFIFIELPEKEENLEPFGRNSLRIFDQCGSRVSIKKIGSYGTRSLYFVVLTRMIPLQDKGIIFDQVLEYRPSSFRIIYKNKDFILKEQLLDTQRYTIPWLERDMLNEIEVMKSFQGHDYGNITHHIFSSVDKSRMRLVVPFIDNASNLSEALLELTQPDHYTIALSLLKTFVKFGENGMTHHDMSTRNLLYNKTSGEVTVIDFARAAKDKIRQQISVYGWVDKWSGSNETRTPTRPVEDILLSEFLNICWELHNRKIIPFRDHVMRSEPVTDVKEYGLFQHIAELVLNKKIITCKALLEYIEAHPFP